MVPLKGRSVKIEIIRKKRKILIRKDTKDKKETKKKKTKKKQECYLRWEIRSVSGVTGNKGRGVK